MKLTGSGLPDLACAGKYGRYASGKWYSFSHFLSSEQLTMPWICVQRCLKLPKINTVWKLWTIKHTFFWFNYSNMLFPSETFQLSTTLLTKCVSRKLFELEIHLKAEMNKLFHLSDTYKPHRKSWEVWTLNFQVYEIRETWKKLKV